MAFSEIIRVCFCNFSFTGGGKTMSGILKLSTFDRAFWIMVVCVTIMFLFVRSRFGRTVQAIREDYIAAAASGINVTYYKVLTFAISASSRHRRRRLRPLYDGDDPTNFNSTIRPSC